MFWRAVCSLMRAEGFFCNFDVLYGGIGIPVGNCSFWSQKFFFFRLYLYFFQFLS
jgi:hypothetical protein